MNIILMAWPYRTPSGGALQEVSLSELERSFAYYGDVYWRVTIALGLLFENDGGRIVVTSRFVVRTEFRLYEPDSPDADLLQNMLLALSEALEAPVLARIDRRDRTSLQSHSSIIHGDVEVFEGLG
jgi:hypothetical protein